MTAIHATAVVDPNAQLGADVQIGPYSIIGADVHIGAGTVIGSHVTIEGPTRIGENNHIYQFNSIGAAPQDKKYAGEPTTLVIGNNNTIREFCTFNRGTIQDRGETIMGDDNWVMAYVHVAHDCVIGSHTIMANNTTLAGHVHVGDWAILGGFTKVHQFVKIGAHSFCAFDADLRQDVAPFVTIAGAPAKTAGINSEGLKRRGYTPEQIAAVKRAYRILFRQNNKLDDAKALIAEAAADEPVLNELLTFLDTSTRGLTR